MNKKKFKINIFTYILLNIMILVLINDYFTYFFNFKYILSLLLSLLLIIIINFFLKRKLDIYHTIEKSDIIFYILLFLIMIITIPYADRGFDTYNYHLYLQENPFGNKLGFDLFAGKNLNSFTYAFSDRLFYLFRFILGYRLGTILNYILLVVLYYQIKNIFDKIFNKKTNKYFVSIFSTICVFSLSIVEIVDSYYIDIISIVLLLESLYIALFSDKLNPKNKNIFNFGYLGLLFGFSFVVKISNAIPIIFIFIIYFINHKNLFKCLNFKNILITVLLFLVPFLIYSIYTFIQTGNPVFPFYNTIFHSKYFANSNWLDTRFGPARLIEVLLWPIIIVFYPGRCIDTSIIEPMWCYGYIISIIYALRYLYKIIKYKKCDFNVNKFKFFISTIVLYLVWSKFLLGYSRYGLIVLVLSNISCCIFVYDLYVNKKVLLLSCFVPFLLYNFAYSSSNYMFKNQDWIYNNYYNSREQYKYNLKYLFARDSNKNIKLGKNSAWAVVYNNSGLLQELNADVPMINLSEFIYLYSDKESSLKNDYTIKLIKKRLKKYDKIYTAVDSLDYNRFLDNLNKFEFEIVDSIKTISYNKLSNKNHYVYIFEIKNKNKMTNNKELTFNEYKRFVSKKCKIENLSMFVGTAKNLNRVFYDDFKISIYGINNGQREKLGEKKIKYNGTIEKYELNIDSIKYDNIEVAIENSKGKRDSNLWVTMLNYRSKCE